MTTTDLIFKIYHDHSFAAKISKKLFPISISWTQGKLLTVIIKKYKPQTIVELGFGFGISSLWIDLVDSYQKKHLIVDPYCLAPNSDVITNHLQKNRQITFEKKLSSQEFLSKLLTDGQKIDLVFIDASEQFDAVMTDMYFINRLLSKNGIVVIRNIWNPAVRKALMFFIKNLPYSILFFSKFEEQIIKKIPILGELLLKIRMRYSHDLLVIKRTGKDTRVWNHFTQF